ncbi:Thiosulfate sulfurtransferase/rhodanese-like domain-containing protein 3 [Lamellibrachia satsuma]|nr:Thiosulfate sulfurtransferase/rhodanese-like domain-containing protein 3 [Lamellibrachia satsuma]
MATLTRHFSRLGRPVVRQAVTRSRGTHFDPPSTAAVRVALRPGLSYCRPTAHFHGLARGANSGNELLQDGHCDDQVWRSQINRRISWWKLFLAKIAPQTKDVSASDVERIVADDTGTLIDVRNPNELEETGKIGDAINVPLDELTEAFNLPEDEFETKYDAPKPSKEADNLVLYCRSGVRAANGCEELSKLGYQKVSRYPGSMNEWSSLHPKVTPKDFSSSDVERMVNDNSGILLDVRNSNELEETGKIGNAINVPLGEIAEAFQLSDEEFQQKYAAPLPPKDVEDMVVYCRSGVRAASACQELIKLGYLKVNRYPGSWLEWEARSPES